MTPPSSSDNRQFQRMPFIQDVEVIGVGQHRCSDLSVGGLYLETVHPFPEGSIVSLRFKLHASDEQVLTVRARVVYVHEGVGLGLSFVDLHPYYREKIETFIKGSMGE
ncbi:MAG TPA: PilZ domain-containing protein [Nitrospiria bacterium]|nr:PilZ domain-containing protein [Nitrospiria bacterium]